MSVCYSEVVKADGVWDDEKGNGKAGSGEAGGASMGATGHGTSGHVVAIEASHREV
jgi:hypothetical protein